jgi:chromosome partitioning protein
MSAIPVQKKQKRLQPFRSFRFNVKQLAEVFGVSRPIIYQLERERVLEGDVVQNGSTTKKLYGWSEVAKLAARFRHRVAVPETKIKVFVNLKGGVGKSTLASQFALRASSSGLRTLLVDLDPQAHASLSVGVSRQEQEASPTIQDAIIGEQPLALSAVIKPLTPLLSIIPANLNMSSLDMEMFTLSKREERISRLLTEVCNDWDLIVVDTNPSASLVNVNAILAADELCVVCKTDFLAVSGLQKLFQIMRDLRENFSQSPDVRIIPNLFDVREAIAQESLGVLRQQYGELLTTTVVRKCADFTQAQKMAHAVWLYNRSSSGADDIGALTQELVAGKLEVSDEVAA